VYLFQGEDLGERKIMDLRGKRMESELVWIKGKG